MKDQELFYTMLTGLANMVPDFVLSPQVIELYDRFLSPFGYAELCQALSQIVTNRNSQDPFPSIREIRELIEPAQTQMDQEHTSTLIANKILQAVSRIGPYQGDLARQSIGTIGWRIVESEGGWLNVCQGLTFENQHQSREGWRKLARYYLDHPDQEDPCLEPLPPGMSRNQVN